MNKTILERGQLIYLSGVVLSICLLSGCVRSSSMRTFKHVSQVAWTVSYVGHHSSLVVQALSKRTFIQDLCRITVARSAEPGLPIPAFFCKTKVRRCEQAYHSTLDWVVEREIYESGVLCNRTKSYVSSCIRRLMQSTQRFAHVVSCRRPPQPSFRTTFTSKYPQCSHFLRSCSPYSKLFDSLLKKSQKRPISSTPLYSRNTRL